MLNKNPIALRYGDFFLCFLLMIIIAEGEVFLFPHAPQVNPAQSHFHAHSYSLFAYIGYDMYLNVSVSTS